MFKNELHSELLGVHALNSFVQHNSSPRLVMFGSHFSQKLTLKHGDEKRIQTGAESELGKHTFAVRMPVTGKIIQILDLYPRSVAEDSIPDNCESYVIYENMETHEIGSFMIPKFISHHQYFGYQLKPTQHINRLVPGSVIEKDTVLMDSPAISENGGYKFGKELNIALMSHPAVAEDGILISEDVLDKLSFNIYERRTVEFGKNDFPLNIYPDKGKYKPYPEIGDYIRDDGVIMILREFDPDLAPIDMSIFDTQEPDYTFDKAVYARGAGGKVVSVKVYHKDNPVTPTPSGMGTFVDKYSRSLTRFYKQVLDIEHRLRAERRKKYGQDHLPLEPEFHQLVIEAMTYLDQTPLGKKTQSLSLEYRKNPLDDYHIEFVIEYEIKPNIGFKLSALHGDKGVICAVEKPENMPVDADGNRADIVMDAASTVSRMNLGRLYEIYIGAACRDTTKRIRDMLKVYGQKENRVLKSLETIYQQNPQLIHDTFQYLLGFYKLITEKQYQFMVGLNDQQKLDYLASIVVHGIYLFIPPDNQKETTDIIKDLERYYPQTYGPVSYVGDSGQRITTKTNIRIGPMYFMLLEKIADDWSAVASGRLQHFGVLAPMTKSEKYMKPWHNSPVRNIGETEGRIYSGYCGREAIAEMMDRANNPFTHRQMVKNILASNQPGNIQEAVDRNIIPLGGSKPLQLFKHFVMCQGWRPVYRKG